MVCENNGFISDCSDIILYKSVLKEAVPKTSKLESATLDSTGVQFNSGIIGIADEEKAPPRVEDNRVPIIEEVVYPDIEIEDALCKDLNTLNGSVYGEIKFINRKRENLEI